MKVLEVNVDDIGMGGVFSLVRNVIEHRPSGMQIDIATIEPFEKEENVAQLNKAGCQVHFVGFTGQKLIKQLVVMWKLSRLVRREKYSCVHIHSDVANKLLVSSVACKISGVKKIILHSHASGVDGKNRKLKKIYHNCCRRFLKYLANEYLSCSDLAAEWMFPNVAREKIRLVKNGIDLKKFQFDPQKRGVLRREAGLESAFVVGHVGRFAYQKNHMFLLDVFQKIKSKCSAAKLLLVGEGELKNDIVDAAKEKGLTDSVIFWGVSNDVAGLMMAMDVFALPSHFEGLPIVGVEAQSTGLPVFFSDCITRTARLTSNVHFLPIGQDHVDAWADAISACKSEQREDRYAELKALGYDISDTVNTLIGVYTA